MTTPADNGTRVNVLDPRVIARCGQQEDDTIGQDKLLVMVAELQHGHQTSRDTFALSAAHKRANEAIGGQDRMVRIRDVVDALGFQSNSTTPDGADPRRRRRAGIPIKQHYTRRRRTDLTLGRGGTSASDPTAKEISP